MPKLQFLTVYEAPGTLTDENVCKVVSNNTDPLQRKNPSIENVLQTFYSFFFFFCTSPGWVGKKINHWRNNIHEAWGSAHLSTKMFCPCEAVDLFLKQGALSDRGKDY